MKDGPNAPPTEVKWGRFRPSVPGKGRKSFIPESQDKDQIGRGPGITHMHEYMFVNTHTHTQINTYQYRHACTPSPSHTHTTLGLKRPETELQT